MNYIIRWEQEQMNVFSQGSEISFNDSNDTVRFINHYFSAGSTIVKWRSDMNYNNSRTSIQLPLLKKGRSYKISSDLALEPQKSILIKLNFYNRSGDLVETIPLTSKGGAFIYPLEAYAYEIELINAGVKELIFKSLTLSGASEEKQADEKSEMVAKKRMKGLFFYGKIFNKDSSTKSGLDKRVKTPRD